MSHASAFFFAFNKLRFHPHREATLQNLDVRNHPLAESCRGIRIGGNPGHFGTTHLHLAARNGDSRLGAGIYLQCGNRRCHPPAPVPPTCPVPSAHLPGAIHLPGAPNCPVPSTCVRCHPPETPRQTRDPNRRCHPPWPVPPTLPGACRCSSCTRSSRGVLSERSCLQPFCHASNRPRATL